MQRIDVCYDSQRLVREREIPIPWPPQKPKQTTKIPRKSMWRARCRAFGSARGREGGCIWTDLFKSTTADALSGFHMRTDDLHPTRKCSQNRCGNMDVPRSEDLSPGPNLRRRSLYSRGAQHPGVHAAGEGDASVAAEHAERERSPRERDSSPASPPPASPALAAMAGCPPWARYRGRALLEPSQADPELQQNKQQKKSIEEARRGRGKWMRRKGGALT